jgi:hypothetical protein
MSKPPKRDEMIRDAIACASHSMGELYKPMYGNYLEGHYLDLIPVTARAVWFPLKQYVVAACHLRLVRSIPEAFHFPAMTLELAVLSRKLSPMEYKDHPYYIGLRAMDLATYEVEIAPFMGTMKPELAMKVKERLKILDYPV